MLTLSSTARRRRELPVDATGHRRDLTELVRPLEESAERSRYFLGRTHGGYGHGEVEYSIPRFVFRGPPGGGDTVRVAIFATIHGDEPEGALALNRFVGELEAHPEIAEGYALFLYPVCNPTGYEDRTRHSRVGKDLNREFWRDSTEPEVQFLESEIKTNAFHGLINLHTDDTSDGLYGYVNGEVLSEHLLAPALRAAEAYLPRNRHHTIDGFRAHGGIIYECFQGVLRSPPELAQPPFEITFETPQRSPVPLQVEAFNAALKTILDEYRRLLALAPNL